MNKLDKDYCDLLQDILENGTKKETRNGGTISVFGRQIRHKMSDGFPLLTTKKMYMKGIITELLWFLRGDTNIKYLVDNNCHIWDGDAYKNYYNRMWSLNPLPKLTQEEFINKIKTDDEFANKWGELGPIYGKQWRSWETKYIKPKSQYAIKPSNGWPDSINIDQIANLINDIKTNPDSRRLMVNAWNVGELDSMVLPPCHYGFQVYTRELSLEERCDEYIKRHPKETNDGVLNYKWIGDNLCTHEDYDKWNIPKRAISLMWNQRSVDTFLGLPFNIASYGLLLEIIAKAVNMVPEELIGNLGDTHLYLNHIEQAKEQIGRELSLDERIDLASLDIHFDPFDFGVGMISAEHSHKVCDDYGIPKRTRQPYPLPTLRISSGPLDDIAHHEIMDFILENYQSHPSIKAPLSN